MRIIHMGGISVGISQREFLLVAHWSKLLILPGSVIYACVTIVCEAHLA
ncbi:MAG: hypothetical protein K0R34_1487 [Herbinix sp.]|jgi:hypothetical protein|nr:hypothetical protein [Herbinix sp.]